MSVKLLGKFGDPTLDGLSSIGFHRMLDRWIIAPSDGQSSKYILVASTLYYKWGLFYVKTRKKRKPLSQVGSQKKNEGKSVKPAGRYNRISIATNILEVNWHIRRPRHQNFAFKSLQRSR
ncbi:hypothetical protein L484_009726 [Morus notabilis]|uniref:Uncharacterized protein n=1 Tax=Morus notabilis TaxID=981085 RepID=W9QJT7_9ROSA|nr:hypothetical protein L484_009726 [Morus notabilis]